MRIAIGGFQHETNTFGCELATLHDFEKHDGWPGLSVGNDVIANLTGMNIPLTGFFNAIGERHELIPTLWCSAEPSSFVTRDAFETITEKLCELLRAAGPLDGVYLDLHGAMVTEHFQDGEGETLARVRQVIGDAMPLVISLDFHANITRQMFERASAMTIFRTYPHLDMAATGARAARLMEHLLQGGLVERAWTKVPFLLPLPAQCTDFEPNRRLYVDLVDRENDGNGLLSIDFAEGFPPADIEECGPAIVAYATGQHTARENVEQYLASVLSAEPEFDNTLLEPREAVRQAIRGAGDGGPIVLADVQDNPGAGASSDTVGLLEALVSGGARGAVMAILNDPEVTELAERGKVGATFEAGLGGKSGKPGQAPLHARFEVLALGDGVFECFGAMYAGTVTNLGPMALLRVVDANSDVRVIVGKTRFQCLDLAIFRHLGVEPTEARILAVKSTVHFRADFAPIARKILVVESPGAHPCRLESLEYRNLREGVRLSPQGREHRRS